MLERSSSTFLNQSIDRDGTFGLTSRFFKKRAVFKKTTMNKGGRVAIPKAESDALELNHKQPVNAVVIDLETNFIATIRNRQVTKDSRGFFTMGMPDDVQQQLGGIDFDMMGPLQFVLSPVGTSQPNPTNQVSPLDNRRRGSFTASRFLVFKSYVSEDEKGPFVSIEPNERDYFELEGGDTLSITTIPVKGGSATDSITRFFNNDMRTSVVDVSRDDGTKSMKVYIDNLLSVFDYDAGTLVQVIGVKV